MATVVNINAVGALPRPTPVPFVTLLSLNEMFRGGALPGEHIVLLVEPTLIDRLAAQLTWALALPPGRPMYTAKQGQSCSLTVGLLLIQHVGKGAAAMQIRCVDGATDFADAAASMTTPAPLASIYMPTATTAVDGAGAKAFAIARSVPVITIATLGNNSYSADITCEVNAREAISRLGAEIKAISVINPRRLARNGTLLGIDF